MSSFILSSLSRWYALADSHLLFLDNILFIVLLSFVNEYSLMAIKAPSWNIELANILFCLVAYCLPYSGWSWTSSMKFKARSYFWEICNVMWTCIKLIYFCYASNWHFLDILCTVLHIAVRLSESLYSVEGIGENGMLIDVLNWLSRLTASVTCFPSSCNAGTCQAISHGYAISRKGIQQKSGFNFFWPFILYRYRHFPWVAA